MARAAMPDAGGGVKEDLGFFLGNIDISQRSQHLRRHAFRCALRRESRGKSWRDGEAVMHMEI
jgi:hypothetical protein